MSVNPIRFLPHPQRRPQQCGLLPQVPVAGMDGYYTGGVAYWGEEVGVCGRAVDLIAASRGWGSPALVCAMDAKCDALTLEITRLTELLAEREQVIAAVDTLESASFTSRRKPGRPKKIEEAVA